MKNVIYLFSIAAILSSSCSTTNKKADCGSMMCTQEFRMVQVTFKDSSGNPLVVKDTRPLTREREKALSRIMSL